MGRSLRKAAALRKPSDGYFQQSIELLPDIANG
jgi:hypothetical protein